MNKENMIQLKDLRTRQDELGTKFHALMEGINLRLKPLTDTMKEVAAQITEVEAKVRTEALEIFKETGNKTLDFGVKVAETEQLNYDNEMALEWAKAKKMCLKLDVMAFKKMAKSNRKEFAFVSFEPVPQARLPTKIIIGD